MLENDAQTFTITDLKQYTYCARILYYHRCIPDIRPVTYKMQAGIAAHEVEQKRAARRSVKMYDAQAGERLFDVDVQSSELALTGSVDEVVQIGQEWVPVDYKLAKKAGHHFKVQLAAYAILLEATFRVNVVRGFLYLIPSRKTIEIPMTGELRREVGKALAAMQEISDYERMPEPTKWRQRCPDCEFRRFCNDVW